MYYKQATSKTEKKTYDKKTKTEEQIEREYTEFVRILKFLRGLFTCYV